MTDVFISYSRKDIAFARLLHQALLDNGLETWIDWQDIPPSADWLAEVYEAIEGADAFVFVISETSLASEICGLEMAHAAKHNKRLIPIVIKDVDAEQVPRELSVLNWIFFEEAGEKFEQAMEDLVTAITVDQDWVKGHTRFENRALDWDRKGRDRGTLLRGANLSEAETWLAGSAGKDPQPTALQTEYILKSREDATRRQRTTLIGVGAALVVAVGLGILAWNQRNVAVSEGQARATAQAEAEQEADARATQQAIAEDQRDIAEEQRDQAQFNLSRSIGVVASSLLGDPYNGSSFQITEKEFSLSILLSLEALNLAETYEAKESLLSALVHNKYLEKVIFENANNVPCVEYDPTGKLIATCHFNGVDQYSIKIWDALDGDLLKEVFLPDIELSSMKFSPNSKIIALISKPERIIYFWDLDANQEIGKRIYYSEDVTASDQSISFVPLSNCFAYINSNGSVDYIDLADFTLIDSIPFNSKDRITGLDFSHDGSFLAVGSLTNPISIWKVDDKLILDETLENSIGAKYLLFDPSGEKLAYVKNDPSNSDEQTWNVLDIETKVIIAKGFTFSRFYKFEFSSDSQELIHTGFNDNKIYITDLADDSLNASDDRILHEGDVNDFSVSPLGSRIVSVTDYSGIGTYRQIGSAYLWNLDRVYPISSLEFAKDTGYFVIYGNEKRYLIAPDTIQWIDVWDLETGQLVTQTDYGSSKNKIHSDLQINNIKQQIGWMAGHVLNYCKLPESVICDTLDLSVNSYTFLPDGKLAVGPDSGKILILDGEDYQTIIRELILPQDDLLSDDLIDMKYSQVEDKLISITGSGVFLWDLSEDHPVPQQLIPGGDDPDKPQDFYGNWADIVVHPTDSIAGVARFSGYVDFWNISTGEWLAQINLGHGSNNSRPSMEFINEGEYLAVTPGNSTIVQIWNPVDFQIMHKNISPSGRSSSRENIIFVPDNDKSLLYYTGRREGLFSTSFELSYWKTAACNMINRNLSRDEWDLYFSGYDYHSTCEQYDVDSVE